MKKQILLLSGILFFLSNTYPSTFNGYTVTKIWDYAPHNAFTDLIRYDNKFYCTFREGTGHVPGEAGEDGKIRVLVSDDGNQWESLALLELQDYDLRDSKLSITPDNRLMLLMGGSVYDGNNLLSRLTHVSFLDYKKNTFTKPQAVKIDKKVRSTIDWLWRVTWFNDTGYGVVYQRIDKESGKIFLVKTKDGLNYSLVSELDVDGIPNESTVLIKPDGEMLIIVRREGGDKNGYIGNAKPPYKEWKWGNLGIRLGGPYLISADSTTYILGTRSYKPEGNRTALFLTSKTGPPRQFLEFPSGGDNSYPGMLSYNDTLWVSYYSSHEGKAMIYLAKIPVQYINDLLCAPPVYTAKKIWDYAPHNAFTDLIRYNGRFYCTFREAPAHAPKADYNPEQNGKIRIIVSEDGDHWESAALIEEQGIDLRDPKLSVRPDGVFMINCGGTDYSKGLTEWHSRVMFSEDAVNWTPPRRVKGIPSNNWFFRITWYNETGYVVPILTGSDPLTGLIDRYNRKLLVYTTKDGINYQPLSDTLDLTPVACEVTIRFKPDSTMFLLIRETSRSIQGFFGSSKPPYKDYRFNIIAHGLGGPNFIQMPDGNWLFATRERDFERPGGRGGTATVLLLADDNGHFKRVAELESGGDTSYPGLLIYNDTLWVSYYSSHEGKASIYLSKIPLEKLMPVSR